MQQVEMAPQTITKQGHLQPASTAEKRWPVHWCRIRVRYNISVSSTNIFWSTLFVNFTLQSFLSYRCFTSGMPICPAGYMHWLQNESRRIKLRKGLGSATLEVTLSQQTAFSSFAILSTLTKQIARECLDLRRPIAFDSPDSRDSLLALDANLPVLLSQSLQSIDMILNQKIRFPCLIFKFCS